MIQFPMIEVRQTVEFSAWLDALRDERARVRITDRLVRVQAGNFGDVKPAGEGVSELRIDYGPGYRVYFVRRGPIVIVLLCGGDKRTQNADIKRAKRMARELE
jgi:putative addiction module killer protein